MYFVYRKRGVEIVCIASFFVVVYLFVCLYCFCDYQQNKWCSQMNVPSFLLHIVVKSIFGSFIRCKYKNHFSKIFTHSKCPKISQMCRTIWRGKRVAAYKISQDMRITVVIVLIVVLLSCIMVILLYHHIVLQQKCPK